MASSGARRPALTAKVLRGLATLGAFAEADIDADPGRWKGETWKRDEAYAALEWITKARGWARAKGKRVDHA